MVADVLLNFRARCVVVVASRSFVQISRGVGAVSRSSAADGEHLRSCRAKARTLAAIVVAASAAVRRASLALDRHLEHRVPRLWQGSTRQARRALGVARSRLGTRWVGNPYPGLGRSTSTGTSGSQDEPVTADDDAPRSRSIRCREDKQRLSSKTRMRRATALDTGCKHRGQRSSAFCYSSLS